MAMAETSFRIAASPVHGHGLFATHPLKRGHLLGHYTGRRISAARFARMRLPAWPGFFFGLADGSVIEGTSSLRFLNHSCTPNCVSHEEAGQISIYTARPVRAGAELTLDYALEPEDPKDYPCFCGSRACRGTMAINPSGNHRRDQGGG